MRFIVFDIETIPQTETAHLWKPKEENEFPPIHVHKIQTIGYVLIDFEMPEMVQMHVAQLYDGDNAMTDEQSAALNKAKDYITLFSDEKDILIHFVRDLIAQSKEDRNICLVSQHGTKFDIPVILTRCFSYSIRTDWYYGYITNKFKNPESKINRPLHVDIKHEFADGMFKGHSLEHMGVLAGLTGKDEVDGSKTNDLYNSGQFFKIAEYCLTDVIKTAFIFLKHCSLAMPVSNNIDEANASWVEINMAMAKLEELLKIASSVLPAIKNLRDNTNWNKYNPHWK